MTTNTPQVAINDIGSEADLIAAIDETIKYFNDGDIVEGTVVKVDHDEVLLDIGYKTEGVILSRELSIKHDVNPDDVVAVGDQIEALVLQKEDKEGRLLLSKKRAQYERAWGQIEKVKEERVRSSAPSRRPRKLLQRVEIQLKLPRRWSQLISPWPIRARILVLWLSPW